MRTIIDDKVYDVYCPYCDNPDVAVEAIVDGSWGVACRQCETITPIHLSDKGRIGAGRVNAELVDEEAEEEESLIDELKRRIERLEAQVDILCDEIGME